MAANLFLAFACAVNRTWRLCQVPLFSTSWVGSGSYSHAFGFHAFLFAKMPAGWLSMRVSRPVSQNHILSCLIWPPKAGLMSQFFLFFSGELNPKLTVRATAS